MESKQVLSIEQMQHLQELGLDTSNASMRWLNYNGINAVIPNNFHLPTTDKDYKICDAHTLQDVLELLPHIDGCQLSLEIDCDPKMIWYEDVKSLDESGYETDGTISFIGDTMLEVAYKSLVWAIKEGYLETDKHK